MKYNFQLAECLISLEFLAVILYLFVRSWREERR